MASWQAHALSFLLRWRFKPALAGARDVAQVRRIMSAGALGQPSGVQVLPWSFDGGQGEHLQCCRAAGGPALLYLHGGGFVACSPQSHRSITGALARQGFALYVPDYRLAPEHPFPAALEDALAAYQAVRALKPSALFLAGDSAGGGLALSLLLALKARGLPLPQAAVLFSPWLDLTLSGASVQGHARRCAMFTPEALQRGADLYLQGQAASDPLASPLWGDLAGLPPLLSWVSGDETLRDDAARLHQRALAEGVRHELQQWPVVPHVWPLFARWLPEGRKALALSGQFLLQQMASSPAPAGQSPRPMAPHS